MLTKSSLMLRAYCHSFFVAMSAPSANALNFAQTTNAIRASFHCTSLSTKNRQASFIERIDKSRAVQLFEQANVDEILRVGGLGRGNPLTRVVNDRFKAIDGRVGLGFNDVAESLVGVLQPFLVFGLSVLGQGFLGHVGIGLQHVDRFHISFEKAPRDIALSCKNTLRCYQSAPLVRNIQLAQIEQDL